MLELEVGKRYQFDHRRKGRFSGVVVEDGSETVRVLLDTRVRGMAEDWEPGEELLVKRSMLTVVP